MKNPIKDSKTRSAANSIPWLFWLSGTVSVAFHVADHQLTLEMDIGKGNGANPTSSTSDRILTNTQLVQKALDAGCVDVDEVVDWVPKNLHRKVGRRAAESSFKAIKRAESSET